MHGKHHDFLTKALDSKKPKLVWPLESKKPLAKDIRFSNGAFRFYVSYAFCKKNYLAKWLIGRGKNL